MDKKPLADLLKGLVEGGSDLLHVVGVEGHPRRLHLLGKHPSLLEALHKPPDCITRP